MVSRARFLSITPSDNPSRVEKYRPDTLEDVSGHQDILATINKFVDTNVGSAKRRGTTRSPGCRDSLIFSCTARQERGKHLQFLHSHVESMAPRTCGRWCSSSTPLMTVVSTSSENRSRPLPARSKSSRTTRPRLQSPDTS